MKIREVNENKKQFIASLLLADEQESMVDRYLEKGTMYVLEDGDVKAECVVTDEGNEILEIKNIAVDPQNQGKGYGKALIDFLASKYADEYSVLQVGTGDSPLTIPFYEKCGFVRSHKIPNFFIVNLSSSVNIKGQKHKIDNAKIQVQLAENEIDQAKQDIYFEVQNLYINMVQLEKQIPLLAVKVKQTLENFELADGRYEVGLGDYIQLQDAKVNYNNAQVSYVQTVYNYNVARANLEKAIALPQSITTTIEDKK